MIVETSVLRGIANHPVACELARALSAHSQQSHRSNHTAAIAPQQSLRSLRKRRRHKWHQSPTLSVACELARALSAHISTTAAIAPQQSLRSLRKRRRHKWHQSPTPYRGVRACSRPQCPHQHHRSNRSAAITPQPAQAQTPLSSTQLPIISSSTRLVAPLIRFSHSVGGLTPFSKCKTNSGV